MTFFTALLLLVTVRSVLICRCKVRWHSDMEECGNKLSVGVEGEIANIIP